MNPLLIRNPAKVGVPIVRIEFLGQLTLKRKPPIGASFFPKYALGTSGKSGKCTQKHPAPFLTFTEKNNAKNPRQKTLKYKVVQRDQMIWSRGGVV